MSQPPPPADAPRLLTVQQAAVQLAVSTRTLWSWIASRRLAAVRLGPKTVRIDVAEITRLVEAGRVGRTA